MRFLSALKVIGAAGVAAGLAGTAFVTRESWKPWLDKALHATDAKSAPAADAGHDDHAGHDHGGGDRVKLSEQAQKNLRLVVEPLTAESYSRTLLIPGMVVDRPGLSDRGVMSPVAGVVTAIRVQPGDTVRTGEPLFTVRLLSEVFQNSQSELFKATKDLQLNRQSLARLKSAGEGTIPQARVVELEQQDARLQTTLVTYRQELLTRGLTPEQVELVAAGKFVSEITVAAPTRPDEGKALVDVPPPGPTPAVGSPAKAPPAFEVKDIGVQIGQQVQAGQSLGTLANHQLLYVEGRAFKQEAGLLEKAAQQGWPVKAEFAEESNGWAATEDDLRIRHLANTVDPVSRTFAFYLALTNQSRAFTKDDKTFLVWRFRPGQRVRLKVPVQQYEGVFVLPADAVVREGAEVYAFRQNGDFFERKPVHLVLEDRDTVLVADDGSLGAGQFVVRNAAAALNRAIKAKAAGGGGHEGHDHAH